MDKPTRGRIAPVEAYRAINAVHYAQAQHMRWGRKPFGFLVSMHRNGYLVTPAAIKTKYVQSNAQQRVKYVHIPRFAWIAWDRGVPVLMLTRYLCGGYSWASVGTNEPTLPLCVKCRIAHEGADKIMERLDTLSQC
jgi:hypothetical protein